MQHSLADLRSIANAVDDAAGTDAARVLWQEAVSVVECQPELAIEPGVPYLLGLAYYELVGTRADAEASSEKFLRLAIEQDPNDVYAKLYLGHLAFDSGQYSVALDWFDSIPSDSFSNRGQIWRDLKAQELRICCLIHAGTTESLMTEFEAYLSIAMACEETDILTVSELPRLVASLAQRSKNAA